MKQRAWPHPGDRRGKVGCEDAGLVGPRDHLIVYLSTGANSRFSAGRNVKIILKTRVLQLVTFGELNEPRPKRKHHVAVTLLPSEGVIDREGHTGTLDFGVVLLHQRLGDEMIRWRAVRRGLNRHRCDRRAAGFAAAAAAAAVAAAAADAAKLNGNFLRR